MKKLSQPLLSTVQNILQWEKIDFDIGIKSSENSITLQKDYYIIVISAVPANDNRRYAVCINLDDPSQNCSGGIDSAQIENCNDFSTLICKLTKYL